MTRLSPLQLQPIIDKLSQAAADKDGVNYVALWSRIDECRVLAKNQNHYEILQWIHEKLSAVNLPDWANTPEVPKDDATLLQFYLDIVPTLNTNDARLKTLLGIDPGLDAMLTNKMDLSTMASCEQATHCFKHVAHYLPPIERTAQLLQLIADIEDEWKYVAPESSSSISESSKKERASSAMGHLMTWLTTIQYEDIVEHAEVEQRLLEMQKYYLNPYTLRLEMAEFQHLYDIQMPTLARTLLVAQNAYFLDPAMVLSQLDNPTPAELMSLLIKSCRDNKGIPALFGQLFNHPDREQVMTQIDRIRLKDTEILVLRKSECPFTHMARFCSQWASNISPNIQESQALNWWANSMLERLKLERMGSEYAFNYFKTAVLSGGMSSEQCMVFDEMRKRRRGILESDLNL